VGHWGCGGYMYMRFHTDAVSGWESLSSPKQKRLSHISPALEFVHLLREKKCYSLYAAAEQVDHSGCKLIVVILQRSA
jgi:hypothetical protein